MLTGCFGTFNRSTQIRSIFGSSPGVSKNDIIVRTSSALEGSATLAFTTVPLIPWGETPRPSRTRKVSTLTVNVDAISKSKHAMSWDKC